MKLGMPILYEFDSIEENILLAKKLELDFIELNLNFDYCRKALEHNSKIKKLLLENNLQVTLHFYDEADFGGYDEVVDAYIKLLKKYLSLASSLGVKLVNVHINEGPVVTISGEKNYMYEKEYNSYIKRFTNNLKKVQTICNKYGALLVLENVYTPKFILNTYEDLMKEKFYFNYDIGHDAIDGFHILKLVEKNPDMNFLEFHIHDANKKSCHLDISKGNLDIKKYKEMAKDAYVVLEVKSSEELISSVPKFKEM